MQHKESSQPKLNGKYNETNRPNCDGCGSKMGRIRLVDVENPDGRITVCDSCEDTLRATIVSEVRVYV